MATAYGNLVLRNQKNGPLPLFTNSLVDAKERIIGGGDNQT